MIYFLVNLSYNRDATVFIVFGRFLCKPLYIEPIEWTDIFSGGRRKMAIIDVIKYDGPPDVFAWKHPNQEMGTWTQLIVNESQEAILYKGGQAMDRFTAGRHTLSTANIPIISNIVNLPFGGKSPFTAEVWFVNKLHSLNIKWGTRAPLQAQDPKYQMFVLVRSYGQFGIQIDDARKFLAKLVGTMPVFNQDALSEYFRGVLMMNIHEPDFVLFRSPEN